MRIATPKIKLDYSNPLRCCCSLLLHGHYSIQPLTGKAAYLTISCDYMECDADPESFPKHIKPIQSSSIFIVAVDKYLMADAPDAPNQVFNLDAFVLRNFDVLDRLPETNPLRRLLDSADPLTRVSGMIERGAANRKALAAMEAV